MSTSALTASGFLLVGAGAACGAWLRWLLGIALNALYPPLPLGTLAANLVGGYLMGLAMGAILVYGHLNPELRLFVTTGFLGGLTTFSAFSGEITLLLSRQQWSIAALGIGLHVLGSLGCTLLGMATVHWLKGGP